MYVAEFSWPAQQSSLCEWKGCGGLFTSRSQLQNTETDLKPFWDIIVHLGGIFCYLVAILGQLGALGIHVGSSLVYLEVIQRLRWIVSASA